MIRSRRTMKNWYSSRKLYFGLNLIVIIGLLLSMVGLAALAPAQPAAAAGGDFSLDFTAAGPFSYDHSTGGGAYNDRTIDKSYGVVESLEGGDFFCGDIVTFLTAITVGGDGSDDPQTIQLDFSFGAQPTGQPGVGYVDVTNVAVNYGPVENGGGGGAGTFGLDTGIVDNGGSSSTIISEVFDPPGSTPFAPPPNDADYVLLTVEVDDLEAGEQVILRVDVQLTCDDDPSTSPTGNVQAAIDSAGVVDPVQDSINVGQQTISLKNPGEIGQPSLTIDKSWLDLNGGAVEPGDTIRYTINYGNNGNADATGVFILDTFDPTDFTTITNFNDGGFGSHTISGSTIRWPSGTGSITLTPGASGSVSYDATLTDPFPLTPVQNVVCIEPTDPDVCDEVIIEEPKLWIDKSWLDLNGGAVEPGDTIRYTINYGNNGNADATGVFIVDDYDQTAFTTITNITNGGFVTHNDNGDTIRWPSGTGSITLTPGASGSVSYDATLNAEFPLGTTYVDNTATIDSNETNPVDDDERVVVVVAECETEAFASNNGPVCQGEAVQLFGLPNGMVSYSWTGPQGFSSTQQNPIRSPAVAGTYTLVVTDADGCTGVDTTLVVVNPLPDCTITAPSPVFPGSTNTASVTPAGGTYFWSVTGEGTLAGGQNTPSTTWTAGDEGTATISVTVTDANGCESTCFRTVTVRPMPTPTPPPPPCSPDIQLAVLLDGSSTMNSTEWQIQLDGLSEAIAVHSLLDTDCMPDCYVELTVIQFAGEIRGDARTEVPPTVINSDNRDEVAQAVLDIVKGGGITPMEAGIDRAVDELRSSPYFRYALKRIINISSDVQENTLDRPATEEARDNAIAAGITEISAEGVGDFRIPEDQDWMVLNILHPQPGHIAPYSWDPGWLYAVGTDADKFKEAICHKIGLITYTLSTLVSPLGSGSVSPSGGTYDAGTLVSLTATANPGYEFNHWSGTDNDTINPTTVTMNTDKSVTAYFTALGEIRTHTWTFYTAGFFPKHLPDAYNGQVVLGDLDLATIPDEVQGVWWYDPAILDYRFWVPGVGGDLMTLTGQFYNYMVVVTGACEWNVLLP